MRVNAKCAHQVRPPLDREQAAARNRSPSATCATDPGNALRFVSRADARKEVEGLPAQIALARRFLTCWNFSERHDA
jgi:hypothetical protein